MTRDRLSPTHTGVIYIEPGDCLADHKYIVPVQGPHAPVVPILAKRTRVNAKLRATIYQIMRRSPRMQPALFAVPLHSRAPAYYPRTLAGHVASFLHRSRYEDAC